MRHRNVVTDFQQQALRGDRGPRRRRRGGVVLGLLVLAGLLVSTAPAAYAVATPTSYWPAEGNADDAVGANHGTLNGGTGFAPGQQGQAFSFDGTDDYIDFGTAAGNFGSSDFTLSFWIETSAGKQSVLGKRPECNLFPVPWWDIRMVPTGELQIELVGDVPFTYQNFSNSTPLNDGSFHHFALVRAGTSLKIYVDGVLDADVTTFVVANLDNSTEMIAGRSPCTGVNGNFDDGTEYLDGLLDEVRIHDVALTVDDIVALMQPATVIVGDVDTGVEDRAVDGDATMNDLIAVCAEEARNHGEFVSCVTRLTNDWRKDGLISKDEEKAIDQAAALSDVGKP